MGLEVKKIAARTGRRAAKKSFAGLDPKEKQAAEGLLEFAQNRHVGLTPGLARSLAETLHQPENPQSPWDTIAKRLLQQMNSLETGSLEIKKRHHHGRRQARILKAAPVYFALRVAFPLVEHACRRVGETFLLSDSDRRILTDTVAYENHEQALCQAIEALAADTGRWATLFWAERAVAFANFLKNQKAREGESGMLPDIHVPGLSLLLRLQPKVKGVDVEYKPIQLPEDTQPIQKILKQREGGVNGIKITRSLDDVNGILHSELALPDVVLMDKLANQGYMVYERNPRKQEIRDALIVGFLSPDLTMGNTLAWLKSCWLETMARLSLMLIKARLTKSDLGWIEPGRRGDWALVHKAVDPLVEPCEKVDHFNRWYRGQFLSQLEWLPEFMLARDGIPLEAPGEEDEEETGPKPWPRAGWRFYTEARAKQDADTGAPEEWISQYKYVHVMHFMPEFCQPEGQVPQPFLQNCLHELGLKTGGNRKSSVVWVPDTLTEIERLACWFDSGTLRLEPTMANSNPDEAALTSWLVSGWLRQFTREIWNA